MSIIHNEQAHAILGKAVEQLQAIGITCLVSPLTLPQGSSVSLHIGETLQGVVGADVATRIGAETANTKEGAEHFMREWSNILAGVTTDKAANSSRKS